MRFLDEKEIKNLQQYFVDIQEKYNNQINGLGKISNKKESFDLKKKISTKISIDFFLNEVKVYVVIPQKEIKQEKIEDENGNENIKEKTVITYKNKLFEKSKFEISDDFKFVVVAGKPRLIPDFYDEKSVKAQDEKTWQMIFYGIYKEKITNELNRLMNEG